MLKKGLCLLCSLVLCMTVLCVAQAAETTTTVMVYMCGADLETEDRSASADIREMISGGITAGGPVRVIIETGGAEEWHTRSVNSDMNMRFEVSKDGLKEVYRASGTRNMGEMSTLRDFISFCVKNYAADRYILVLWDHGGGPMDGICFDELYDDDALTMAELTQALKSGLGGNRLDAVIFDACLMGSWEVACTMQPFADYMGASEDSEPGDGLNYKSWLKKLTDNPSIPIYDLMEAVSDSLVDTISASDPSENTTFSILDLSKLDELTRALGKMGTEAAKVMKENPSVLTSVRESVLSYGEFEDEEDAYPTDLVDIRVICELLESVMPDATAAVLEALQKVVIFNDTSASMVTHAYGLSVFWPAYTVSDYPEYLSDYPAIATSSAWSSFAVSYGNEHAVENGFHMFGGTTHTSGSFWSSLFDWDDDDDSDYDDDSYGYYYDDDDDDDGYYYDDDDDFSFGSFWDLFWGDDDEHTSGPVTADGAGSYHGLWSDLDGVLSETGVGEGSYPGLWSDLPGYTGGHTTVQQQETVTGGSGIFSGLWDDLK